MLQKLGSAWLFFERDSHALATLDGTTWKALCIVPPYPRGDLVSGRLWIVAGGRLYRGTGAGLEELGFPGEAVSDLSQAPGGELRVLTDKGVYGLGADDIWHSVSFPDTKGELPSLANIGGRWTYSVTADGAKRLYVEGASGPPVRIDLSVPPGKP